MQLKKIKRSILPLVLSACTVFFTVPAQAADISCRSAKDAYQKAAEYALSGKLLRSHEEKTYGRTNKNGKIVYCRIKRFTFPFDKKKSKNSNIQMLYHAKYADDGLHTWGDYIRMELNHYSNSHPAHPYNFYDCYWSTGGNVTVQEDTTRVAKKELAFMKSAKKKAKAITKNKKGNAAKTRAIYNWVIKHISYDYLQSNRYAYEAYYNKKAVCQGYANLMYVMCRDVGIPCRLAYNAKMNHEWVLVKIKGKWYQCDPTWGDAFGQPNTYFLRGTYMKGHKKPVSFTSCKLPKISKKAYYR